MKSLNWTKTTSLSVALLSLPMMIGITSAYAGSKHRYDSQRLNSHTHTNQCPSKKSHYRSVKDNYSDERYLDKRYLDDRYQTDVQNEKGRYLTVGYRNRSRKICKRPVVGIGYGTSKSLARANAVQAWSREAKRRYKRRFRLRNATIISNIRCQYTGNGYRGKFSRRSKRFDLPGEAGNPNHKWNCSVNAKPCFTKNSGQNNNGNQYGSRFKRKFCRRHVRKSMRHQRRNINLGCEYRGRNWHSNYRRHMRKCMRRSIFRSLQITFNRQHKLRRCR